MLLFIQKPIACINSTIFLKKAKNLRFLKIIMPGKCAYIDMYQISEFKLYHFLHWKKKNLRKFLNLQFIYYAIGLYTIFFLLYITSLCMHKWYLLVRQQPNRTCSAKKLFAFLNPLLKDIIDDLLNQYESSCH